MKNDILIKGLIFLSGAITGSLITYKALKNKYDFETEELETEDNASESNDASSNEEECIPTTDDFKIYTKIASQYKNYSKKIEKEEKKAPMSIENDIHVVSPEDFSDTDYDTESLTYFADGVLTDIYDNRISNVEDMVGTEWLTKFGEYEEDTVYVINDKLKMAYEILRDDDKYYEKYPGEKDNR